MQTLLLKPAAEKRILKGHRWIFSNEISSPLKDFSPGSWVEVQSARGSSLGSGYINPNSLITVRLVCPPGRDPDKDFFRSLLQSADRLRAEVLYPKSQCYRMVFAESDGLPGLVVDRYGDVLVYQITTLGMAMMEDLIRELLIDMFQPRALIFRNDSRLRLLEDLPLARGVAFGSAPKNVGIVLDGLEMLVDPLEGQKTGFYLDQRDNRAALPPWAAGKKVLDLFCHNGAWGLYAAKGGAAEVVGVDQSQQAIELARNSAAMNGFDGVCRFVQQDAVQFLKETRRESFDTIILDPPAFAKTKRALPESLKGYIDVNRRALLALKPGGLLVSCSCSYHVNDDLFHHALLQAAQACTRRLRILEARGQAKDHPVLLAMPETKYLKCLFLEAGQSN